MPLVFDPAGLALRHVQTENEISQRRVFYNAWCACKLWCQDARLFDRSERLKKFSLQVFVGLLSLCLIIPYLSYWHSAICMSALINGLIVLVLSLFGSTRSRRWRKPIYKCPWIIARCVRWQCTTLVIFTTFSPICVNRMEVFQCTIRIVCLLFFSE